MESCWLSDCVDDASMSDTHDLSHQIAEDATRSQNVTHDGISITRRSLKDQIEADKYLAQKSAAQNMGATIKNMISRIVPPGGH